MTPAPARMLAAFLSVFSLANSQAADKTADDRRLASAMDRAARAEVLRGFSGAVVVTRGGTRLLDRAYGSERGIPVRSDTRFWIASTGKQFTSAAVLRCRDKGWLRLDDPLSKFFPDAPADKRAITVRHLLAHLSGLDQSYVSEGVADRQSAVGRMLGERLVDAPGSRFHYSNSNYQLAVAVVEIASGRSYRRFVREELWRPAGLRDTGFAGQPGAARVAPTRGKTPPRLREVTWGGEGVYSTARDLLKWYRALRDDLVISSSSVGELFAPTAPIEEGQAALGWFLGRTDNGRTRIFTRGNEDFGANSLLYAYPDSDAVIIVFTHAGDAPDGRSWSRLVHARLEALLLTPGKSTAGP